MTRATAVAFCIAVQLVACGAHYVRFDGLNPAAIPLYRTGGYRQLWRDVERCSGQTADFSRVHWWVVPDSESFPTPLGDALGITYQKEQAIVLAGLLVDDAKLVRHEIAHLVASRGWHDPAVYQHGPCAPLMICWSNCLVDTTQPSDSNPTH